MDRNLKKKRRAKPIKNKVKKFKMLYSNMRGLLSKKESLEEIIEEVKPTLICLTETHLKEEEEFNLKSYKIFRNDRIGKDGGGVLFAVDKKLKDITVEVEKCNTNCETLWVVINNKHGRWGTSIRAGIVYAPQECRTKIDVYKEIYKQIEEQIEIAGKQKQRLLLMGDFNCKIGLEIDGNKEEITKSAKYLLKLRDRQDLQILNSVEKCEGLWTRVQGDSKSVLDYVIVWKENQENLLSMLIDEKKEFAPAGIDENNETVFSDHNTIICDFNWLIEEEEKKKEQPIITRKGYGKIEREISKEKVSKILTGDGDFEDRYGKWKKKLKDIFNKHSTVLKKVNKTKVTRRLLKARRKIKKQLSSSTTAVYDKTQMITRIKLINEYIKEEENKQYQRKMKKVVDKLKSKGGINGVNTWELMKQMKGKKQEKPTSVWAKDGEVLETEDQIIERHKEHYFELLQTKEAVMEEEMENERFIEECSETILKLGMIARQKPTEIGEIKECISELKKKKCRDKEGWRNEHFINGGMEMVKSLHLIFTEMESGKFIPSDWNDMIIKSVHKKGPVQDMNKKRGLFLTNVMSKIYEKVLKKRNKEKIDANVSETQVGGKKHRSTVDLMILLSDIVRRNKKIGRKTYLLFGDAIKCFDKLWLRDCLVEMYKMGIDPQDILMIYLLNKTANIVVKTPVGDTNVFTVTEIVKQGTIWGPEMCCIETDSINRIGENCKTTIEEIEYGVLGYVDDVLGAGSAEKIRKCARCMRRLEILKKYTFGMDKTHYLIMNTGKEEDELIEEELEGGKIERTEVEEYLGFWLNENGNCMTQIEKKSDELMGELSTIRKLACKESVGILYFCVRLFLFEACIIASMLYGFEAWSVTAKEIEELERLQGKMLCKLLEIPKTTPYWGLLHETGVWSVKWRLAYRKIMLFHNIMTSEDARLVKGVVLQQVGEQNSFYEEACQMAAELGLTNVAAMEKSELKKKIKLAVKDKMDKDISLATQGSTKLRFIKTVQFGQATYFDSYGCEDVNLILKLRLNMVDVHSNYKGDISKKRMCVHCNNEKDTTEHLGQCPNVFGSGNCVDILCDRESTDWKWLLNVVRRNFDSR